jgi:hypothetical protein
MEYMVIQLHTGIEQEKGTKYGIQNMEQTWQYLPLKKKQQHL